MNERFTIPQPRISVMFYAQFLLVAMMVGVVAFEAFVVLPEMRSLTEKIQGQRDGELKHANLIDAARNRQVVQEATILLHQRDNLKVAEQIGRTLKGDR